MATASAGTAGGATRCTRLQPKVRGLGRKVGRDVVVAQYAAVDPNPGDVAGVLHFDLHLLGDLMIEAHALLKTIGVSTQDLDELVALSMRHGALGAKLSGAGGGGVVVALVPEDPEPLLQAALHRGIQAFACTLPRS